MTPDFLKNLPIPARMLFRPMLMISLVLHGIVVMLPIPSDLRVEQPKTSKQYKQVKIAQLPTTRSSPNSSPQSSAKPNPQPSPQPSQPTPAKLPTRRESSSELNPQPSPQLRQSIRLDPPTRPKRIAIRPHLDESPILERKSSSQLEQQPKKRQPKKEEAQQQPTPPDSTQKPNPETPPDSTQKPNPETPPDSTQKPNPETPQNSNQQLTSQTSKPNPETPQNSNQQPTSQASTPNSETPQNSNQASIPSPNESGNQTGSGDSDSDKLNKFMNNRKPSDYLLYALEHLKNVENDLKKSAELENCSQKTIENNPNSIFNCRLTTNSSTAELISKLGEALEKQTFQGFSQVDSYRNNGTLYKAKKNEFVPYFLITTDSNGKSMVTLLDKEPS